ncbi:MAG: MoxR family ATPase [Deltaproteobacteria bacterium]|nr:MoxR family ATPase [Deltaproteobacteria bacterium]
MTRAFIPSEHTLRARPPEVQPYLTTKDIELAVNVAIACDRPLLLLGPSGSGKSTLARFVAWCLGSTYVEHVITSRTAAEDLKWRFDAVRRLHAAQAQKPDEPVGGAHDRRFTSPGVLWEAFDPTGAATLRALAPASHTMPARVPNRAGYGDTGTVVLLDEIDKADPDVPNDLLVTLDARWFQCTDLDEPVSASADRKILVMITSNEERELPRAFVRRCIVLRLTPHSNDERRAIAERHHPGVSQYLLDRIDRVFERVKDWAKTASAAAPSTAEYLDAVKACLELDFPIAAAPSPADELDAAVEATLWKQGARPMKKA